MVMMTRIKEDERQNNQPGHLFHIDYPRFGIFFFSVF